jgi:peptidoglycan/LPS O-acetylase OafA/YrhL
MEDTARSFARAELTTAFDQGRSVHHGRFAIADALRLTAILAVVVNHLVAKARPSFLGRAHDFTYFGVWGVAAFFVLSGYLLSAPYLRALLYDKPWPSIRLFLLRRVLRIVPLYLVAIAFSVLLARGFEHTTPGLADILSHALMLQDFSPTFVMTLNGPLWTMPVDFEFYLALPVFAFAAAFIVTRRPVSERPQTLSLLLLTGALASIAYRFFIAKTMPWTIGGAEKFVFIDNGIGMASAFLIGIGLALAFEAKAPALSRGRAIAGVVAAVVLFFALERTCTSHHAVIVALRTLVAATSAGLLLYSLPVFSNVVALTQTRAVALGASLAYAIYLFHVPILEAAYAALHLGKGNASFAILSLVTLCVLVPIAYLAHRFIERPFLLIKDRQREGLAPAALRNVQA